MKLKCKQYIVWSLDGKTVSKFNPGTEYEVDEVNAEKMLTTPYFEKVELVTKPEKTKETLVEENKAIESAQETKSVELGKEEKAPKKRGRKKKKES